MKLYMYLSVCVCECVLLYQLQCTQICVQFPDRHRHRHRHMHRLSSCAKQDKAAHLIVNKYLHTHTHAHQLIITHRQLLYTSDTHKYTQTKAHFKHVCMYACMEVPTTGSLGCCCFCCLAAVMSHSNFTFNSLLCTHTQAHACTHTYTSAAFS